MKETTTFYIADHQIDLSRSVVTYKDEATQVEPKVLSVLLLLAQRQNEVVTHKEIMEHVWQGTEVVPNALQRCIAILRKVLNDDAKSPSIIATHPRIGYRLLAEVNWEDPYQNTEAETNIEPVAVENNTKRLGVAIIVIAFAFTLLISTAVFNTFWSSSVPSQYTRVNKLTQTDAHETHATFNPSAEYLVFNRYAGSCRTHLWAKHLKTGQENQLTEQPGNYGAASFTQDGRELVFAANNECDNPTSLSDPAYSQSECWSIATLDFAKGLSEPQKLNLRYQCQAEVVQTPKALSNHRYAFLQQQHNQHQLVTYNDLDKSLKPIYTAENGEIYHFDYEPKSKQYVVFGRDNDFNNTLKIIDENGILLKEEIIELSSEMSQYQKIKGNFGPNNECMLAVANSKLYRLDYDGKLHTIVTPEVNLISAMRHPNSNELVAVEGGKDVDIAQIDLTNVTQAKVSEDLNSLKLPFTSFARTKKKERNALFQPGGETIAFISNRSGRDQIWLWKNERAIKLNFATEHYGIRDFRWSPDGTEIALVSADKLTIVDLNGKVVRIKTSKPLYSILGWYSNKSFLVTIRDGESNELYKLDAETGSLAYLDIGQVENAWIVDDKLIYRNANLATYIRPLNEKGLGIKLPIPASRSMVLRDGVIYSVNDQSLELSSYDTQGQLIQSLAQLKHNAWVISDIRQDQLLLSQFVAINHDIVLLK